MSKAAIIYKSKISYGLFMPILVPFVTFMATSGKTPIIIPLAISIITVAVLYVMLFNTKYIIDGKVLKVKCGFIVNTDIEITSIKKIAKTGSVFSAPAMSLDRIEVFYNKYDSVVISPRNRENFCETLKQINSAVIVKL